jgi:hypothetical protein
MSESVKPKKETSGVVAILKTLGFFAVLFLAGWFFSGLVLSRIPRAPNYDKDYVSVDWNTLSQADWYMPLPNEPVNQERMEQNKLPEDVKALNGKKVAIGGFMMPVKVDDENTVTQFALNGNYDACFYGAPTQIDDWVVVQMKDGKKAPFTHKPITIYGTLEVGEEYQDGELVSVFRMQADAVATDKGVVK